MLQEFIYVKRTSLYFRTVKQFQNFYHAVTSLLLTSLIFHFMPPHFYENKATNSFPLPLTHSRDIAARFGATVSSDAGEPSVSLQPSCLLHRCHFFFFFARVSQMFPPSAASHRVARRWKTVRREGELCGVGRLPEGLRDDGKERLNYRLKSGTAGRLFWGVQGRRRKVGIWRTRSPHADERGERLFKFCSVVGFGGLAGTA